MALYVLGHGTKDEPKTKTLAQGNAVSWLKLKFPGNHSNALHTNKHTQKRTHTPHTPILGTQRVRSIIGILPVNSHTKGGGPEENENNTSSGQRGQKSLRTAPPSTCHAPSRPHPLPGWLSLAFILPLN